MDKIEELEQEVATLRQQMTAVTEALVIASEMNGAALEALLSLLSTLGPQGLIDKGQDGKSAFVEAVKSQHARLYDFNAKTAQLLDSVGLESEFERLIPNPVKLKPIK